MKKKDYEHYRKEDKKILKIDLDIKNKKKALEIVSERLSYMHDLSFFSIENIDRIHLIKKTGFGAKIYLKKPVSIHLLIILQLMLGSDYRKEVNTMLNFFKLEMQYFNRLFDIKMYKDGKIKEAKIFDITQEVLDYVLDSERKKNKN